MILRLKDKVIIEICGTDTLDSIIYNLLFGCKHFFMNPIECIRLSRKHQEPPR